MSLLIKALKQAERQHATASDASAEASADTAEATLERIQAAAAQKAQSAQGAQKAEAAPVPSSTASSVAPTLSSNAPLEFAPMEAIETPPAASAPPPTAAPKPAPALVAPPAPKPAPPPAASTPRPVATPLPSVTAPVHGEPRSVWRRWLLIGGVSGGVLMGVLAYQWFAPANFSRSAASVTPAPVESEPVSESVSKPTAATSSRTPARTTTRTLTRTPEAAQGVAPPPAPLTQIEAPNVATPSVATPSAATSSASANSAVRFLRTEPKSEQLMRTLQEAYAALRANDLEVARQKYEQALALDRNHIDAWLGMATLAQRAQDPAQGSALAQRYYERALEIDPNDSAARSGLLALRQAADAGAQESQLRSVLARDAQQPAVHFALGNLLATQGRWNEAQQSYFNAHQGDPAQPDYAFNLAVALDRMRQPQLARQFYRKALELSERAAAHFDPAALRSRIEELTRALTPADAAVGAGAAAPDEQALQSKTQPPVN